MVMLGNFGESSPPGKGGGGSLTQIGGRIYRATDQTGLSSPTPFLPTSTDYLKGVIRGTDVSTGADGLEIVTDGLYIVTVNILIYTLSHGGATPGNAQLLVHGGGNDVQTSAYANGVFGGGGTSLSYSDTWNLVATDLVYVEVDTPDDGDYRISGAGLAADGASTLAIAYAGGTVS